MSQTAEARREIAGWGYATPAAASHVHSALGAIATGALSALDPFRSSLPETYRMPVGIADAIALRSDWSILAMDYWHVLSEMHGAEWPERQQSLFDLDNFVH